MLEVAEPERKHLLELARDKTLAGRRLLAATVGDLFLARSHVLSDREWALMNEILRRLVHDVENSVRLALAERLARSETAPYDLIVTLANDEVEVAHPILVESQVLQDLDLVEIIRHRTLEHQLAIAIRREVSEAVSDALVETAQTDVIKTLLENEGAAISRKTMEYLVEQSQRVDCYQNPLLRRRDLDPALARRMYWWVSAALRHFILDNYAIEPIALDDSIETAVRDLEAQDRDDGESKALELAEAMARTTTITPKLMLSVLRGGEVLLFTGLFSKFTGIRPLLVNRLMYEAGGEALAIACRAAGIDRSTFGYLFMLTRKLHADSGDAAAALPDILRFYDQLTEHNARGFLAKWQRDPDYLRAIWQVEHAAGG